MILGAPGSKSDPNQAQKIILEIFVENETPFVLGFLEIQNMDTIP